MLRRDRTGPVNDRLPPGGAPPMLHDPFLQETFELGRRLAHSGGQIPRPEPVPQLVAVSRLVNIATTAPTLVVPQNLNRVMLRIPNVTGKIFYVSYTPDDLQGIPVGNNGHYVEPAMACVLTDIYVRVPTANVVVRAYEYFRATQKVQHT